MKHIEKNLYFKKVNEAKEFHNQQLLVKFNLNFT